jgi:hypothetical protein
VIAQILEYAMDFAALAVSAQPRHKRPLADVLRGLEKIN